MAGPYEDVGLATPGSDDPGCRRGRLEEADDPRFVLLCDPARTPAQPLIALMLLTPTTTSRGLWRRAGFDTMTLQELLDTEDPATA